MDKSKEINNSLNIIDSIKKNLVFQIIYFAEYVSIMKVIKNECTILVTEIDNDNFNIVIDAHFSHKNADQKIDEIVAFFQNKSLPFSWWLGPSDSPPDLKERLVSKGFLFKGNDYGMYLDLKNYVASTILSRKLEIKQVLNPNELKEFDEVHVISFGNSNFFELIYSKIPSYAYDQKAPFRFYTGYLNGKAVTTGVLAFHANVVGIYYIATLPEERRKGYATEMMHYLLCIAKEENQKIVVLEASEEGKKVYEKIGFKECYLFQEFFVFKKNINIETERLILKPFCENDISSLTTLLKDPDVMKFSIKGPYSDEDEIKKLIDQTFENQKKYGIGMLSVFLKEANVWIGFCGLFKEKDSWDFGYRFLKNYWGQGYASEAVEACSNYFKKNIPNETIYCYIEPENIASLKIAKKCDMKYLGKDVFHGLNVVKYQI